MSSTTAPSSGWSYLDPSGFYSHRENLAAATAAGGAASSCSSSSGIDTSSDCSGTHDDLDLCGRTYSDDYKNTLYSGLTLYVIDKKDPFCSYTTNLIRDYVERPLKELVEDFMSKHAETGVSDKWIKCPAVNRVLRQVEVLSLPRFCFTSFPSCEIPSDRMSALKVWPYFENLRRLNLCAFQVLLPKGYSYPPTIVENHLCMIARITTLEHLDLSDSSVNGRTVMIFLDNKHNSQVDQKSGKIRKVVPLTIGLANCRNIAKDQLPKLEPLWVPGRLCVNGSEVTFTVDPG